MRIPKTPLRLADINQHHLSELIQRHIASKIDLIFRHEGTKDQTARLL